MQTKMDNVLNNFLYRKPVLKVQFVTSSLKKNIYFSEVVILQQMYFFGRQLILLFLKHMHFEFLYLHDFRLILLIFKAKDEKLYYHKIQIP